MVGIELDRLVIVLDGAVVLAFDLVGVATIEEGISVFRIELDGLVIVLDGAVVLAFALEGEATIEEGVGVSRIELDRLTAVQGGAVKVALVMVGGTTIIEGKSVFRIELNGLPEVLDGAVVFVSLVVGDAAVAKGEGEALSLQLSGIDNGRTPGDLLGRFRIALTNAPIEFLFALCACRRAGDACDDRERDGTGESARCDGHRFSPDGGAFASAPTIAEDLSYGSHRTFYCGHSAYSAPVVR